MTHAYNPRIQKTGNFETSLVYTAISRSARVIQRSSVSKHKGKNARQVVCPCDLQTWEVGIGRPQVWSQSGLNRCLLLQTKNKQSHFFLKENKSFKPNLDVISVERNGKWCVGWCQRFLNVLTTQKAQVTESKCTTNQKNPLKRERKKSKRNCHGNQGWYCSSAKFESQKGGRLLRQCPMVPE